MVKKILLVALMACSTQMLHASSSLNGGTGLIKIPTGEALHYREYSTSLDYMYHTKYSNYDKWVYQFNLGIFEKMEIGFQGGTVPTEGVYLNAKYYVYAQNEARPVSLAIGTQRFTSREPIFYVVMTKKFHNKITIHGGLKSILTEKELQGGVIAGIQVPVERKLDVLGDINYENKEYQFNFGLKYSVTPEFSIRASALDALNADKTKQYFTVGLYLNHFL